MRRAVIIVVLALWSIAAHAQTQQVRQYAAKFVCGNAGKGEAIGHDFAAGSYYTVINVHNPARLAAIEFRKKFAFAGPRESEGKISPWYGAALHADGAMRVDCGSIYAHLNIPPGTFIDGFVVLELPPTRELDVVGVYTVASSTAGLSSIEIERVPGRLTQ
jgi:hypothetical protein